MTSSDTIYALSSGGLPSGVAVVRLSGSKSLEIAAGLCRDLPEDRKLVVREVRHPDSDQLLDQAMVCVFRAPASFTGEDVVEFHLHGGVAVLSGVYDAISCFSGARMAEAGEFSKRAFENGKLDLTEAEGLADLIASETSLQRELALYQANGGMRSKLEDWRLKIVRLRAFIDAEFDFSDEEDVPDSMLGAVKEQAAQLIGEIETDLSASQGGEIIRDGFRVALMGPPNAGKSSLLNALAKRDVAIVSDIPGTTRDLIEVRLDLNGVPVVLTDTAGIRASADEIEKFGITKAIESAKNANLIIWLSAGDSAVEVPASLSSASTKILRVSSKNDLIDNSVLLSELSLNTVTSEGLDEFLVVLMDEISNQVGDPNSSFINRHRHKAEINACLSELCAGSKSLDMDMTLASEHFRLASEHLGRLTGRVNVEDLLDVIFSEFCVGK